MSYEERERMVKEWEGENLKWGKSADTHLCKRSVDQQFEKCKVCIAEFRVCEMQCQKNMNQD